MSDLPQSPLEALDLASRTDPAFAQDLSQQQRVTGNTLSLVVGGQIVTGWESIRVTRSCERVPADFDIRLTERYPGAADVVIKPGDPCQVKIGDDLVITGYVDRYMASFSSRSHEVRVCGRSKSEDLVDCSIDLPNEHNQLHETSLLGLAQKVAAPYNVTVSSITGDNIPISNPNGSPVQFNFALTETPYEIIERVARYAGVLVYDSPDGSLLLAKVGQTRMASGFAQGVNVQVASVSFSMDERYQVYEAHLFAYDDLWQYGQNNGNNLGTFRDEGVPRFRLLAVVSDQSQYGQPLVQKRAQWEMARRRGRSQAVRLTCDSWRDSAGNLWAPNAYAMVNLPALKLTPSDPWIIGEVSFLRDGERGTVADLMLMPSEAFVPEPSVLELYDWQVGQALPGGTSAPPATTSKPEPRVNLGLPGGGAQ